MSFINNFNSNILSFFYGNIPGAAHEVGASMGAIKQSSSRNISSSSDTSSNTSQLNKQVKLQRPSQKTFKLDRLSHNVSSFVSELFRSCIKNFSSFCNIPKNSFSTYTNSNQSNQLEQNKPDQLSASPSGWEIVTQSSLDTEKDSDNDTSSNPSLISSARGKNPPNNIHTYPDTDPESNSSSNRNSLSPSTPNSNCTKETSKRNNDISTRNSIGGSELANERYESLRSVTDDESIQSCKESEVKLIKSTGGLLEGTIRWGDYTYRVRQKISPLTNQNEREKLLTAYLDILQNQSKVESGAKTITLKITKDQVSISNGNTVTGEPLRSSSVTELIFFNYVLSKEIEKRKEKEDSKTVLTEESLREHYRLLSIQNETKDSRNRLEKQRSEESTRTAQNGINSIKPPPPSAQPETENED